jgi:hypothetical protein
VGDRGQGLWRGKHLLIPTTTDDRRHVVCARHQRLAQRLPRAIRSHAPLIGRRTRACEVQHMSGPRSQTRSGLEAECIPHSDCQPHLDVRSRKELSRHRVCARTDGRLRRAGQVSGERLYAAGVGIAGLRPTMTQPVLAWVITVNMCVAGGGIALIGSHAEGRRPSAMRLTVRMSGSLDPGTGRPLTFTASNRGQRRVRIDANQDACRGARLTLSVSSM